MSRIKPERALPPDSPLSMPRASLHEPRRRLSGAHRLKESIGVWMVRVLLFFTTTIGSAYGVLEMKGVISTAQPTPLQLAFLFLFALNFTWIMFALCQAVLGFCRVLTSALAKRSESTVPLAIRTALLLPVYNEEPHRISAAVTAMATSLAEEAPGSFDIFILSDSNRVFDWVHEEEVFRPMILAAPQACPIFYRHRRDNRERKAGNIAEWVSRFGGAYEAMTILDADSIMSAKTLIEMTRRMEVCPQVGLIQSIPAVVFGNSPYARLQQFANRCYGPIYANGLAAWHGQSSNFWGHNAIIRVRAFAESARLPRLAGEPPFGGDILSHDFAEAAFLRRAGWSVRLDADLQESYEEAPPSLLDVIVRDRRWCQGNFQHSKLLVARGMHPCSRLHFATGILSYLTAPIWLLLIFTGLLMAAQVALSQPEYFAKPSLFPTWPVFDSERALRLFMVSMGVVLLPKVLGWLSVLCSWKRLWGFGGPFLLTVNVLLETVMSALYAPIMMLSQTAIVVSVLARRDAGWQPQRRADGAVPATDLVRAHLWHTLLGLCIGGVALWISLPLFFWLLPITAGLTFSMLLSWVSGQGSLGYLFGILKLLQTPEDKSPTPILQAVQNAFRRSDGDEDSKQHPIERLATQPDFAAWHAKQLEPVGERRPEDINDDLLAALAKSERVSDPRRLAAWLTPEQARELVGEPAYFHRPQSRTAEHA